MSERQALGIDIHEYSRTGGINYSRVKDFVQAGIYDFLIIKAGLGFRESSLWKEQKKNVEAINVPYVTYHFVDPDRDEKKQISKYIDRVGKDQPNYILDVEIPYRNGRLPTRDELLICCHEVQRLTGKLPIIYSTMGILDRIGFRNEARKYKLWIAVYKRMKTDRRYFYRKFDQFVRDYAWTSPSTVRGTGLEKNVVLWQFTEKGDGRYYIFSARTKHPRWKVGAREADLNISIKKREIFMQSMFGDNPVTVDHRGGSTVVDIQPPPGPPYPGKRNQDMINWIFRAAKPFTNDPWIDWVVRAGLSDLAIPAANRNKPYMGPRIEDLPIFSEAEKAAILAAMF
jgi:GH25 family lysozyme M1 (1,4-beta-N-acetylmuramidase)